LEGQNKETDGASEDYEEVYDEEPDLFGGKKAWITRSSMETMKEPRRRPTTNSIG
jgi:hypothetical protein